MTGSHRAARKCQERSEPLNLWTGGFRGEVAPGEGVAWVGGSRWLGHRRAALGRRKAHPLGRRKRSRRVSRAGQCRLARENEVSELLTPHSQWECTPFLRSVAPGSVWLCPPGGRWDQCGPQAPSGSNIDSLAEQRLSPPFFALVPVTRIALGLNLLLSPERHFTSVDRLSSDPRLPLAKDWKISKNDAEPRLAPPWRQRPVWGREEPVSARRPR